MAKKKQSKPSTGADFADWMDNVKSQSQAKHNAWDTLPAEALNEIREVATHNDKNPGARIPSNMVLERLKQKWGMTMSHSTLIRLCRVEFGRKSWSEK